MAEYRLYGVGESGNAYKVALMLNLCRLEWEPVFVDFFNGEGRTDQFRDTVNELGEIPALEHDGKFISQSGVILHYLAEQTGHFGAGNAEESREILRWILFDNHKFTSYLATLRFMFGLQKTGDTPITEFLRGRVLGAFSSLRNIWPGRTSLSAAGRQSPTSPWSDISILPKRRGSIGQHSRIS
ncbi:MAG: glutathione S-transferase [Rhodospirillales bacterium]|nr:glutathione S-transferase [Rhodospirillales bacterium]